VKPNLKQGPGAVASACYLSYMECINGTIVIQTCPGIKGQPMSKIINAKTTGGVAHVVHGLPSKREALSLNLSTTEFGSHGKR
jgi:hypothetical protein